MRVPAQKALDRLDSKVSRWPSARRRFRSGLVFPQMEPTFTLKPGDKVFTMGSCFARNIEASLQEWGFEVPLRDFQIPDDAHGADAPADTLTMYNPPTFRQEIAWAENIYARDGLVADADCDDFLVEISPGIFRDLGLNRVHPTDRASCIAHRQTIYETYKHAFSADCLIMTPGVSEVFRNRRSGFCSNPTPVENKQLLNADDWEFGFIKHDETVADLLAVIDLVRKHNPVTKVLITVSPVPLWATFSGQDVVVANSRSKAILRSACASVIELREMTDYFPSYEAVTLSTLGVWQKDKRHVTDRFVQMIVQNLAAYYVPDLGLPYPSIDDDQGSLLQRLAGLFRF